MCQNGGLGCELLSCPPCRLRSLRALRSAIRSSRRTAGTYSPGLFRYGVPVCLWAISVRNGIDIDLETIIPIYKLVLAMHIIGGFASSESTTGVSKIIVQKA